MSRQDVAKEFEADDSLTFVQRMAEEIERLRAEDAEHSAVLSNVTRVFGEKLAASQEQVARLRGAAQRLVDSYGWARNPHRHLQENGQYAECQGCPACDLVKELSSSPEPRMLRNDQRKYIHSNRGYSKLCERSSPQWRCLDTRTLGTGIFRACGGKGVEGMSFEEELMQALKRAEINGPPPNSYAFTLGDVFDQGFTKGARWAYRRGFMRAVALLRSDAAEAHGQDNGGLEPWELADWLEKQLEEK